MIDVVEITLNEFKEDIYAKYIKLYISCFDLSTKSL